MAIAVADSGHCAVDCGLAAWLIKGFRLKNGVVSAILGGIVYAVLSAVILRILGLDVNFTRAAALITTAPVV